MPSIKEPVIRLLGLNPYQTVWEAMRTWTQQRKPDTPDELWCLEHPSVLTQGQAGRPEHLLKPTDIPLIQTDRGGQITYHGPGQLIIYTLIDLKRKTYGVSSLVTRIERAIIHYLNTLDIQATTNPTARGIYINNQKIASIGLRVAKGCSFHGLALNVNMDLTPFENILPCGLTGITMTQLHDLIPHITVSHVRSALLVHLLSELEYDSNVKSILKG